MTTVPSPPGDTLALKCQCADLWAHPAAQLLLGPSLHPGVVALTAAVIERMGLSRGATVLDVGCGPGTSLRTLRDAGLRPLRVDYSLDLATEAAAEDQRLVFVGDAEALALRPGSLDGALLECVLSAFPDKARALAEVRRVLPVGAPVALTDMTRDGPLPWPLDDALAWVACAAGALTGPGYRSLLAASGFRVVWSQDRTEDLAVMVAKARRRLALFRGAAGIGLLPSLEEFIGSELTEIGRALLGHDDLETGGRQILAGVSDSVRRGRLGYTAIVATAV